jgi:hypothetical protein
MHWVLVLLREYDLIIVADMRDAASMASVALAVAATTTLMSGAEGVVAMKKAATVAKSYKPGR